VLRQEWRNNDEAHRKIANLEDLKRRVEEFPGAAPQFMVKEGPERAVVAAQASLSDGSKNIRTQRVRF
jgi:hypothetical protein